MALLIYIVKDPTGSPFTSYLQVEDISANLIRSVSAVKLPGDTNLLIDLGMSEWELSINGIADNEFTAAASGQTANIGNLVAMRTWSTTYTVRLYFDSGCYADGKITGINTRRESGNDYWTFMMSFVVETMTVA